MQMGSSLVALFVALFVALPGECQSQRHVLVSTSEGNRTALTTDKPGKCPGKTMPKEMCADDVTDQCYHDNDCHGSGKCCSTGCNNVCVRPVTPVCELARENTIRRGRALGLKREEMVLPLCDPEGGDFTPVQCSGDRCFCVDQNTGFELPGTRKRSLDLVNCSDPSPCAGYQCRMLCPFDFALDDEGCPLCQCRDPCLEIQCPKGSACVMERVPCDREPCPPLPTCKQPRSLSGVCPFGDPIYLDDKSRRPFLCGSSPEKPRCPPLYKCQVDPGREYGVCCPDVQELKKPGSCPPPEGYRAKLAGERDGAEEVRCGVACNHDIECPSVQKCCMSKVCGQHCVRPNNLTACLQERMIAELLILSEKEGKGYVPQCQETDGTYLPRQCSRNGLVCWCVEPTTGRKYPRTVASKDRVSCQHRPNEGEEPGQDREGTDELHPDVSTSPEAAKVEGSSPEGDLLTSESSLIQSSRPYDLPKGSTFYSDLPKLEERHPTPTHPVPPRKEPKISGDPEITRDHTQRPEASSTFYSDLPNLEEGHPTPTHPIPSRKDPQTSGDPEITPTQTQPPRVSTFYSDLPNLEDEDPTPTHPIPPRKEPKISGDPEITPDPTQNEIETKVGNQCSFTSGYCVRDNRCHDDEECPGESRCCILATCGGGGAFPTCVVAMETIRGDDSDVISNSSRERENFIRSPTMCEYLRDLAKLEGVALALPVPRCQDNGAYEPIQCQDSGTGSKCWCVDDYGAPIPGTETTKRGDQKTCSEALEAKGGSTCPEGGLVCRLGCDYGFIRDPGTLCPQCQCRDPCEDTDCGAKHECQMVEVPCIDGVCPPIPQCVPIVPNTREGHPVRCPGTDGSPSGTVACKEGVGFRKCPNGYECHITNHNGTEGICCPLPEAAPQDDGKPGQCPYLLPKDDMTQGSNKPSCDLECTKDSQCHGSAKCCSNGCGTHCQTPIRMTACQHQRAVLEYRAREAGIPSDRVFLPKCDATTGGFQAAQCHPGTLTCWCVDPEFGMEVPGTRVSYPSRPNCEKPLACPAMNCNLACLHGYRRDVTNGCPICGCRDPCEEVTCPGGTEECRIVHVACAGGGPCPPLPVCLPKLENPCPTGTPLSVNGTMVECGPQGQTCPSSHKCHLSPLGEYALCCPKPRDACFLPRDSGDCEGSIRRWHFEPDANECRQFRFGGCGGNLNNFDTLKECQGACPPLTSCQRLRRENLSKASKGKMIKFIPKCDPDSGNWLPAQCLEQLGLCWCVDDKGSQLPGSLSKGPPSCRTATPLKPGSRTGRVLTYGRERENAAALPADKRIFPQLICDPGQTVQVCDKSVCENKVCLSHPGAVCRVNPCGGCSFEFIDSVRRQTVNCDLGLTSCQKSLQTVLNSQAFQRPNRIVSDEPIMPLRVLLASSHSNDVTSGRSQTSNDVTSGRSQHSNDVIMGESQEPPLSLGPRSGEPQLGGGGAAPSVKEFYPSFNQGQEIPTGDPLQKPGTCPALMKDFSLLQCNPTRDCSVDSDCPGDSKCCFTGCGTICLEPAESGVPLGMTLEAPQCHSDGSWVREQRSGDLTWCVDPQGRPMHETLTRGHVRCASSGQILEQMSLGFVCPRGVRSMVCTDECVHAVCTRHPSAVCIADPCNQCKVSFYSASGESVNCEEECSQPLSTGEECQTPVERWFYNTSLKQCQEFQYGGCHGNENNFQTLPECQAKCGAKVPTCDQPVEVGGCSDGEARWYYNKDTRKCELFLYSGCAGNDNNFPTKEACENTCPDLILCPYWSDAKTEPVPCSRSTACQNQTCHGYPDTICKVDPCTCSANFYNLEGERVTCMMPTEEPKTRISFTYEEESSSVDGSHAHSNGGTRPPVTIFLKGEPTLTRCQLLRQHLLRSDSKRYVAQCDENGRFVPTQCYSTHFARKGRGLERNSAQPAPFVESFVVPDKGKVLEEGRLRRRGLDGGDGGPAHKGEELPECWCVDEIGRKTQPTVYFKKGERTCETAAVESVVVTLGFRNPELDMRPPPHLQGQRGSGSPMDEIKKQVGALLKHLSAETLENRVRVISLPDLTQVKFTLLGKNKVDVAYQLEDQVRQGGLSLRLGSEMIPADLRASWFHHQVAKGASTPGGDPTPAHLSALRDARPSPREVLRTPLDPPSLWGASAAVAILAVVLICVMVVSIVLHRRRLSGQYPKVSRGSLQSLAFSDTSSDRRSMSLKITDSPGFRRHSMDCSSPPSPYGVERQKNVATIEEEYKSVTR